MFQQLRVHVSPASAICIGLLDAPVGASGVKRRSKMTSLLGLDLALLLGQSIGMPRVAYFARRAREIFEDSILQQPYSAAACTPLPTCRSTPAGGRWGGSWACRGPHKAASRAVSWSIPEAHHIRTPTNTQAGVLASSMPSGHVPLLPPQSPCACSRPSREHVGATFTCRCMRQKTPACPQGDAPG